ncbi:kinase-like domain-containing protein [Xylariaceae sp. AK1471]|nr:kinase-like domain-containing protein [Xylariaceae sp. AK1471]
MASITTADQLSPLSDNSTFDMPRLFSSSFPLPKDPITPCNFITFLAMVQKLRVPLIRIMWEERRQPLGRGGTSQVSEGIPMPHARYAFKRVAVNDKREKPMEEILRCLINEITIIWHLAARNHPNIIRLLGVCWEISPNDQISAGASLAHLANPDKIWPVLVFEKSDFADLYQFARSPIGRGLSIRERLSICLQIGNAIAHMQVNHIIHGDIKPHNVFIFKGDDDSFVAKVADFGFSTWHADHHNHIVLPESWPWYAPECHEYPQFSVKGALKTDVFSFGMLCLWFTFEKNLSGLLPLPAAESAGVSIRGQEGVDPAFLILENSKKENSLVQLARQLVAAEAGLDAEYKRMLYQFFGGCLSCDPRLRDATVEETLKHATEAVSRLAAPRSIPIADHDFQSPLYTATIFQRAWKSDNQPTSYTYNIEEIQLQLKQALGSKRVSSVHGEIGMMLVAGEVQQPNRLINTYQQHEVLEVAESFTRNEADLVEHILGAEHPFALLLKSILHMIMESQGRWREAEELQIHVLNIRRSIGQDSNTLAGILGLVSTYVSQWRWNEAEELQEQAVKISRRTNGPEHKETLIYLHNLTNIYSHQGKYKEAEDIQAGVVEVYQRTLGRDDWNTLSQMLSLSNIYSDQKRWKEAEEIQIEVMEKSRRVAGQDHFLTLRSVANLADTYSAQGRWKESEKLQLETIEISKRMWGQDVPDTLILMQALAGTYAEQGLWEEAGKLHMEVMEAYQKTLGPDHMNTAYSMHCVAACIMEQGHFDEAEKLTIEALEIVQKARGREHFSTTFYMAALARIYDRQGRLDEAEALFKEVENIRERILGYEETTRRLDRK